MGAFSRWVLVFGLCALSAHAAVCDAGLLGPSPYLSFSDSPFNGGSFSYFYLEDFEDGFLSTPGASVDHGTVLAANSAVDSVDADDGSIDGSGAAGASIYHDTSLTFSFDEIALGGLPTHAGIAFTDDTEGGLITFEAFDQNGVSLGTLSANLGDGSFFGTTAEDRFFGVTNVGGISRIFITDNGSQNLLEVDHLQYGRAAEAVPEPTSLALLGTGVLGLCGYGARRRAGDSQVA